MSSLTRNDVVHCAPPLSHATALMTALCPTLVAGCTLVLRRRLVPSEFWSDVAAQHATHLLYVGEVVRTLLSAPSRPKENEHQLRVAYGNGMALDVWHRFQARFGIPRIFEYYGATELALALVNLAQEPGFIGRTPLGKLSPWRIVARDAETGELTRGLAGTCVPCPPSQPGELISMLFGEHPINPGLAGVSQHMQFVHDVVSIGDHGLRTGDIVRRDGNGYVKFEDRTFEIFRQQGRNVSTAHLVKALRGFDGVADVGVTHVILPCYDGQLGLAVVVPTSHFELANLAKSYESLGVFERPRFLRLAKALRLNRGLKFDHAFYRREGVDPGVTSDPIFVISAGGIRAAQPRNLVQVELGSGAILRQYQAHAVCANGILYCRNESASRHFRLPAVSAVSSQEQSAPFCTRTSTDGTAFVVSSNRQTRTFALRHGLGVRSRRHALRAANRHRPSRAR